MTNINDVTIKPIYLYFCPINNSLLESEAEVLTALLSQDELAKVRRRKMLKQRDQALLVRGILRLLLSKHSHIAPDQWCFEYGDKGKPRLTAALQRQAKLDFNISHSGDYLLVGIAAETNSPLEFGVDIERERSRTDIYPILNHYFADNEVTQLMALDEGYRRQRFFDLWALKEAYIKAKGLGLALSLQSFYFDFEHQLQSQLELKSLQQEQEHQEINLMTGIRLVTEQGSDAPSRQWSIALGRLNECYRFAIAMNSSEKECRLLACKLDISELLTLPLNR